MSEYDRLSTLSEEELYAEIGRAIEGDGVEALPRPVEYFLKRGRQFVDNRLVEVRPLLCPDPSIRRLAEGGFTSELFLAVSAAIESLTVGTAVSPLAILICRTGIKSLCAADWNEDSEGAPSDDS